MCRFQEPETQVIIRRLWKEHMVQEADRNRRLEFQVILSFAELLLVQPGAIVQDALLVIAIIPWGPTKSTEVGPCSFGQVRSRWRFKSMLGNLIAITSGRRPARLARKRELISEAESYRPPGVL